MTQIARFEPGRSTRRGIATVAIKLMHGKRRVFRGGFLPRLDFSSEVWTINGISLGLGRELRLWESVNVPESARAYSYALCLFTLSYPSQLKPLMRLGTFKDPNAYRPSKTGKLGPEPRYLLEV